jgi:hypothetical protein
MKIMRDELLLASTLALLVGCDLPPIEYETEHLMIGTDREGPLRAGTLHEFDQQVQFVEQTLDFEVEGKLEVHIFEDGVDGWCQKGQHAILDHISCDGCEPSTPLPRSKIS